MSAALIDAGNGLIEAYDGGSTLGIEKAKAVWAEAVESFDEQAEDQAEDQAEEDTGDPDAADLDVPGASVEGVDFDAIADAELGAS